MEDGDWLTIPEAAGLSGCPEDDLRRWARRVKPDGLYPYNGALHTDDLPATVRGADLRRTVRGRIMIRRVVAEGFKASRLQAESLRAAGWKTAEEMAAEFGVSVREVQRAVKESVARLQAAAPPDSPRKLSHRVGG